jgi:hypothetical protein
MTPDFTDSHNTHFTIITWMPLVMKTNHFFFSFQPVPISTATAHGNGSRRLGLPCLCGTAGPVRESPQILSSPPDPVFTESCVPCWSLMFLACISTSLLHSNRFNLLSNDQTFWKPVWLFLLNIYTIWLFWDCLE